MSIEAELYDAVQANQTSVVKDILDRHPDVNVSFRSDPGDFSSALHTAAVKNNAEIIRLLLKSRKIQINQQNRFGMTALHFAAIRGNIEALKVLLKHPYVRADMIGNINRTPLRNAATEGGLEAVKWLIASGKELGSLAFLDFFRVPKEIETLLSQFQKNPGQVRKEVRRGLGLTQNEDIRDLFAQVVFLSDGLLRQTDYQDPKVRFFSISARLPLELQMILCHRTYASPKDLILIRDAEPSFRALAAVY
ncbi:MAG: ankyrin repeat domain-containing protein [Nitrososphaerales archaeon]